MVCGAAALSLAGCGSRIQSALDPAGVQAAQTSALLWMMFAILSVTFFLVLLFLWRALARMPRVSNRATPRIDPAGDSRTWRGVGAALIATVIALFALLVASLITGARLASLPSTEGITIEVIGHQWWWEVRYPDPQQSRRVTTANEIHIPVGTPVTFKLTSADVIHSFWVPNLAGKRDTLPGQINTFSLRADRPGIYRGQCAEFCGLQHARMALYVIAEPRNRYEAWLETQRRPAAEPRTETQRRGKEVFIAARCAQCHTVRGTPADGRVGPDLTHVASRRFIAAGTLPNTRGNLAGWILDPQGVKPGAHMPANPLAPDDSHALLEYLESLR